LGLRSLLLFRDQASYGTPAQWVDFINACHAHGIAVIVDVVYNHMSGRTLLRNFGGFSSAEYPNGIYFNDAAHGVSPGGRGRISAGRRSQRTLKTTR